MEPSQAQQNWTVGATVTLCTAATSSLAGVYALTASIGVTIVAAVVTLGLTATTHPLTPR